MNSRGHRSPERTFTAKDMPVLPGTSRLGLLVLAVPDCPLAWQAGIARHARLADGKWVLHVPSPSPLRVAQDVRRTQGVLAVAVQPPGPVNAGTRLALAFAEHLRAVRAVDQSRYPLSGAFVTSTRPDVPGPRHSQLRLFHLATIHNGFDLVDAVVWEWIDRPNAEAWFGGPLPNLVPLEMHLAELLQLRRAVREHRYPDTPDGEALADALEGQAFSGRFVLDHYYLVCRLVAGHMDKEGD